MMRLLLEKTIALFRERGMEPNEAAVKGAMQVATPVFFAVLTTMTTFAPMLAVEGEIGSIWRIFPLVVISVLIWSLIESLTILPAHLAHSSEKKSKYTIFVKISEIWQKIQSQIVGGLNHVIKNYYKPLLKKSNKPSILSSFICSRDICINGRNSCQWLFKILFFSSC